MNKIKKVILLLLVALITSVAPFGTKNATASPLEYDYQLIYQSPYPESLPANSTVNVYIDLKNTGTSNWYKNGEKKIRLGSGSSFGNMSQKRDYPSEFANENWPSENRPSEITNAEIVKPGEIARFQFDIRTPETIGEYEAYFTPVVDGLMWMKDMGIYWKIKTTNEESPTSATPKIIATSAKDDIPEEPNIKTKKITKESIAKEYRQSISKLICHDNERMLQQGSGTLIYNESQNPNFAQYYIITNRHVVDPSDTNTASCSIYIYPESGNSLLKFESYGFKQFGESLDLAVIEPRIITGDSSFYGTEKDLEIFSKSNKSLLLRDFVDSRSNLDSIVFGYPKNGDLKITNGALINAETYRNNRFINTLAPVDHGNSGGLAIDSDGYILGIPTNKLGDVGMILDLEYIVSDLGINIL